MKATVINPPLPKQYGEELLVFTSGRGCRLVDQAGKSYLDMGSGIAVNALGYGREDLAEIAFAQMKKLIHVSNLFATVPQLELAWKIVNSGCSHFPKGAFEAVHFGNSGAEANETALKYARLYSRSEKGEGHHRLIAFSNSFHGRSMGALSITASEAYRKPFEPLVPGSEFLPLNDVKQLENTLDATVAAVIVEPVQGEGGLNAVSKGFASALNSLCGQHNILLIADEVQTGLGRCAAMFASQKIGLEPDIICLAKPLAGGLPLSAVLVPQKVNRLLKPGHHATTFGGGPVTTAVASRVWDIISEPDFLVEVERKGELIKRLLNEGIEGTEVRGMGMLRGLRLNDEHCDAAWCTRIIAQMKERGVIILKTGADVLRLAPPLTISDEEIQEGIRILFEVIHKNLNQ